MLNLAFLSWNVNKDWSYIFNITISLLPRQYFCDYNAKTIYVRLECNLSTIYKLWCHVSPALSWINEWEKEHYTSYPLKGEKEITTTWAIDNSQSSLHFCSKNLALLFTESPWETEISNFRNHITIQQYICRLKIQMDNTPLHMEIM